MEGFPVIKSSNDTRQHTADGKYADSTGLKCLLLVLECTVNMAYGRSACSEKSSEGSAQAAEGCEEL